MVAQKKPSVCPAFEVNVSAQRTVMLKYSQFVYERRTLTGKPPVDQLDRFDQLSKEIQRLHVLVADQRLRIYLVQKDGSGISTEDRWKTVRVLKREIKRLSQVRRELDLDPYEILHLDRDVSFERLRYLSSLRNRENRAEKIFSVEHRKDLLIDEIQLITEQVNAGITPDFQKLQQLYAERSKDRDWECIEEKAYTALLAQKKAESPQFNFSIVSGIRRLLGAQRV